MQNAWMSEGRCWGWGFEEDFEWGESRVWLESEWRGSGGVWGFGWRSWRIVDGEGSARVDPTTQGTAPFSPRQSSRRQGELPSPSAGFETRGNSPQKSPLWIIIKDYEIPYNLEFCSPVAADLTILSLLPFMIVSIYNTPIIIRWKSHQGWANLCSTRYWKHTSRRTSITCLTLQEEERHQRLRARWVKDYNSILACMSIIARRNVTPSPLLALWNPLRRRWIRLESGQSSTLISSSHSPSISQSRPRKYGSAHLLPRKRNI